MDYIRKIYNRRKVVNRLRKEGLTPQQISYKLNAPLLAIRKDLLYLDSNDLPQLEDKFTRKEISKRFSISLSEVCRRLSAINCAKPDAVFLRTYFYLEKSIAGIQFLKLPFPPLPKHRLSLETLRLDRVHQICALRATGIKVQDGAKMLGLTPSEANRLISQAVSKGINVRQITADVYADLCLTAYKSGRDFPPAFPMGDNLALISRITAFKKGVPIELISAPGESCWSPEVGAKEIALNRGQLNPEEYQALENLSQYKIAVWKMRRDRQATNYHRKEAPV